MGAPPEPPQPPREPSRDLANMVAGDEATCERAIREYFGAALSCRLVAGYGVECGMPGAGCASANPGWWGACLEGP